jgi:hypothetical protein
MLASQATPGEARHVVDRLRHASTTSIPLGDVLRDAHRPQLPLDDPRVRRQADKIAAGRPLRRSSWCGYSAATKTCSMGGIERVQFCITTRLRAWTWSASTA